MNCPYKLLGITKDANNNQIKQAYRKLSMKYHSDLTNKTTSTLTSYLKDINNAYNILIHNKTKKVYDKFHEGTNYTIESFVKIFNSLETDKRINRSNGKDIYLSSVINLEQINDKKKIKIEYETFIECWKCNTKGWITTKRSINCNNCGGYGIVTKRGGITVNNYSCFVCNGKGTTNVVECLKCNGSGRLVGKRDVELETNTLTKEGHLVCFNKRGEAGINTGLIGDLYVKTIIKSHEFYIKNNLNLHCIIRIKPITAIMGGNIVLKTITKSLIFIIIPKQRWENLYLIEKGRGLEGENNDIGDIIIKLILKYNTYGSTSSVKIPTSTISTLYKINKLLEMTLSGININIGLINV